MVVISLETLAEHIQIIRRPKRCAFGKGLARHSGDPAAQDLRPWQDCCIVVVFAATGLTHVTFRLLDSCGSTIARGVVPAFA